MMRQNTLETLTQSGENTKATHRRVKDNFSANSALSAVQMFLLLIMIVLVLTACTLTEQQTVSEIPTVEFLYPLDNTSVLAGTDVQIRVLAQDETGSGITRVELLVDDQPHQHGSPVERPSVQVFTIEMNWLASGDGLHALTAIAYRADGTESRPITIRVSVIAPTEEVSNP